MKFSRTIRLAFYSIFVVLILAVIASPAGAYCWQCDILTGMFPERAICVHSSGSLHSYQTCTIYYIGSLTTCVLEGDFCYLV